MKYFFFFSLPLIRRWKPDYPFVGLSIIQRIFHLKRAFTHVSNNSWSN